MWWWSWTDTELDIQVGKIKILQMPWGIIKDKEDLE
jgi:hypothetical protein